MNSPAMKCVAVSPTDVAVSPRLPDSLTLSRMVLKYESNWASLILNVVRTQSRMRSRPVATWLVRSEKPLLNCDPTSVKSAPMSRIVPSSVRPAAAPGFIRRCSQLVMGRSRAVSSRAMATGTTISDTVRIASDSTKTAATMSSSRHAQSLATLMPGGTAAASTPGSSGSAVLESASSPRVPVLSCVGAGTVGCGRVAAAGLSVTTTPYAGGGAARARPTRPTRLPAYAQRMSATGERSRPSLGVTGSTGWLGGLVARGLAGRGGAQRLLVRDVSRAPGLPSSVAAQCSYRDADAARAALDGVETLFMVSAAESEDRLDEHRTFVDAAAAAGVRHVVYVSFFGAAPDATFTLARDHAATEQHLRDSGMAWTFLRDNLYLEFMDHMVGEDGVVRGPAGDGRAAVVSHDDIARVVVTVLLDPAAHAGATYDLTGPEALTFTEMAEVITEVTGRE